MANHEDGAVVTTKLKSGIEVQNTWQLGVFRRNAVKLVQQRERRQTYSTPTEFRVCHHV